MPKTHIQTGNQITIGMTFSQEELIEHAGQFANAAAHLSKETPKLGSVIHALDLLASFGATLSLKKPAPINNRPAKGKPAATLNTAKRGRL